MMLFLHRKLGVPAARRLLSSSPPPLYGGYDEATFKYIAESISPFISNFLKPTITHVSFGRLTMELPVNTGYPTVFSSFYLKFKPVPTRFHREPNNSMLAWWDISCYNRPLRRLLCLDCAARQNVTRQYCWYENRLFKTSTGWKVGMWCESGKRLLRIINGASVKRKNNLSQINLH